MDLPPGSGGEFGRDSIPGTGSSKEHQDLSLQDLSTTTIPPSKRSRLEDSSIVVRTQGMPVVGDDITKHGPFVDSCLSNGVPMEQALPMMGPDMRDYWDLALLGSENQVPAALRGRTLAELTMQEFKGLVDIFSNLSHQSIVDVFMAFQEMMRKDWLREIGSNPLRIQVMLLLATKWCRFAENFNMEEATLKC